MANQADDKDFGTYQSRESSSQEHHQEVVAPSKLNHSSGLLKRRQDKSAHINKRRRIQCNGSEDVSFPNSCIKIILFGHSQSILTCFLAQTGGLDKIGRLAKETGSLS